jgi:hypothetical protein
MRVSLRRGRKIFMVPSIRSAAGPTSNPAGINFADGHGRRLAVAVTACTLVLGSLTGCGHGTAGSVSTRSDSSRAESGSEPARAATDSAFDAGQLACRGLTPIEAARHFRDAALAAKVRLHFVELVAEPGAKIESSSGYPRLVAALYATTVPAADRASAAAGCAKELSAANGGG